jgi:hypothetical protein
MARADWIARMPARAMINARRAIRTETMMTIVPALINCEIITPERA